MGDKKMDKGQSDVYKRQTWNIADGDITVKGASDESGNYNNVKQGEKDFEKDEGETVITGESDKNLSLIHI